MGRPSSNTSLGSLSSLLLKSMKWRKKPGSTFFCSPVRPPPVPSAGPPLRPPSAPQLIQWVRSLPFSASDRYPLHTPLHRSRSLSKSKTLTSRLRLCLAHPRLRLLRVAPSSSPVPPLPRSDPERQEKGVRRFRRN
jgi:hypothetical protein